MKPIPAPATPIDLALLQQDNRPLQARCATLTRALLDAMPVQSVVGVYGRGDLVHHIVDAAQLAEVVGYASGIRFVRTRDAEARIVGVELVLLRDAASPSLELVREADGADLTGDAA
jgi:hypothetical protein